MVRMLQLAGYPYVQRQHEHHAGCGHQGATSEAAPVQRSAVHDVLRSSGRPLDDDTRTEMESRLGADFSDVRVHSDSAARASAAEVGARAYTSGSHVVIGDGGGDKHTLAHELTHVIQQRSGPVAGTDNGAGLSVSDPSDRFERAAEENARRAMSGPAPAHTQADADVVSASVPGAPSVQRMTEEEYRNLHDHPQGPAVRFRGPRESKAKDRAPYQLANKNEWKKLSAEQQKAPKQRIDVHDDPQTLREVDEPLLDALAAAGKEEARADNPELVSKGIVEWMGRHDPKTAGYWRGQDERDAKLTRQTADRVARYGAGPQPGSRRPNRAQVDATIQGKDAVTGIRDLLQGHDGVAIGGSHSKAPVWGFVIDNAAVLKAEGVTTIYLESLRDDSYQDLVDKYLSGSSNQMPKKLEEFVKFNDAGNTLGNRGMKALLVAAKENGLRVKGIGGRPARRLNAADLYLRAAKMNTYAEQVVERDRRQQGQGAGKYLMELGAAHATLHAPPSAPITSHGAHFTQPFPGMSDLLGIPPVGLPDNAGNGFRQL
ncbi:DUF4157 domain-containing protein [Streptomyces sp. NPDC048057]|uniref:eCIS core domain-containing protein n=1 Tax=Streptomyces sp. NPDC048057 TaxID=3155628 RepID=UPI0033C81F93